MTSITHTKTEKTFYPVNLEEAISSQFDTPKKIKLNKVFFIENGFILLNKVWEEFITKNEGAKFIDKKIYDSTHDTNKPLLKPEQALDRLNNYVKKVFEIKNEERLALLEMTHFYLSEMSKIYELFSNENFVCHGVSKFYMISLMNSFTSVYELLKQSNVEILNVACVIFEKLLPVVHSRQTSLAFLRNSIQHNQYINTRERYVLFKEKYIASLSRLSTKEIMLCTDLNNHTFMPLNTKGAVNSDEYEPTGLLISNHDLCRIMISFVHLVDYLIRGCVGKFVFSEKLFLDLHNMFDLSDSTEELVVHFKQATVQKHKVRKWFRKQYILSYNHWEKVETPPPIESLSI